MAIGFPAMFLSAAAIAEYVLITRLIHTERPVIGTLLALGARRSRVVRHYLWYGAVVAAVAALAGVLVGGAATSAYTHAYAAILRLPDTVIEHRIPTAVIGFVLGLAAGVVGRARARDRRRPNHARGGDARRWLFTRYEEVR